MALSHVIASFLSSGISRRVEVGGTIEKKIIKFVEIENQEKENFLTTKNESKMVSFDHGIEGFLILY